MQQLKKGEIEDYIALNQDLINRKILLAVIHVYLKENQPIRASFLERKLSIPNIDFRRRLDNFKKDDLIRLVKKK